MDFWNLQRDEDQATDIETVKRVSYLVTRLNILNLLPILG